MTNKYNNGKFDNREPLLDVRTKIIKPMMDDLSNTFTVDVPNLKTTQGELTGDVSSIKDSIKSFIKEAPSDGRDYTRRNKSWHQFSSPGDYKFYAAQDNENPVEIKGIVVSGSKSQIVDPGGTPIAGTSLSLNIPENSLDVQWVTSTDIVSLNSMYPPHLHPYGIVHSANIWYVSNGREWKEFGTETSYPSLIEIISRLPRHIPECNDLDWVNRMGETKFCYLSSGSSAMPESKEGWVLILATSLEEKQLFFEGDSPNIYSRRWIKSSSSFSVWDKVSSDPTPSSVKIKAKVNNKGNYVDISAINYDMTKAGPPNIEGGILNIKHPTKNYLGTFASSSDLSSKRGLNKLTFAYIKKNLGNSKECFDKYLYDTTVVGSDIPNWRRIKETSSGLLCTRNDDGTTDYSPYDCIINRDNVYQVDSEGNLLFRPLIPIEVDYVRTLVDKIDIPKDSGLMRVDLITQELMLKPLSFSAEITPPASPLTIGMVDSVKVSGDKDLIKYDEKTKELSLKFSSPSVFKRFSHQDYGSEVITHHEGVEDFVLKSTPGRVIKSDKVLTASLGDYVEDDIERLNAKYSPADNIGQSGFTRDSKQFYSSNGNKWERTLTEKESFTILTQRLNKHDDDESAHAGAFREEFIKHNHNHTAHDDIRQLIKDIYAPKPQAYYTVATTHEDLRHPDNGNAFQPYLVYETYPFTQEGENGIRILKDGTYRLFWVCHLSGVKTNSGSLTLSLYKKDKLQGKVVIPIGPSLYNLPGYRIEFPPRLLLEGDFLRFEAEYSLYTSMGAEKGSFDPFKNYIVVEDQGVVTSLETMAKNYKRFLAGVAFAPGSEVQAHPNKSTQGTVSIKGMPYNTKTEDVTFIPTRG